jgi:hypothetical protein
MTYIRKVKTKSILTNSLIATMSVGNMITYEKIKGKNEVKVSHKNGYVGSFPLRHEYVNDTGNGRILVIFKSQSRDSYVLTLELDVIPQQKNNVRTTVKVQTPVQEDYLDRLWFKQALNRMNRIDKELLLRELYFEKQKASDEKTHQEIKRTMKRISNDTTYYQKVCIHIKQLRGFVSEDPRGTGTKLVDFLDSAAGFAFDMIFSGKPKRSYSRRVTHCRRCSATLDSAAHRRCRNCNWIVCPSCNTCGCR